MAGIQDGVNSISEGFKNVFLAGIGALAIGGEKGKELVDTLVAKGEMTIDQGKQINRELQYKADEATKTAREAALEARMKAMSPEQREAFAAKAAEFAAAQNAQEAAAAVEVEIIDDEEAAEEPAPAEDPAAEPAAAEEAAPEAAEEPVVKPAE